MCFVPFLNNVTAHYLECLLLEEQGRTGHWVTGAVRVCVCGACNGRWGCAAAHWTERCRKWGARFHIWRGGPPMRTGTGVCVWITVFPLQLVTPGRSLWGISRSVYTRQECVEGQRKCFDRGQTLQVETPGFRIWGCFISFTLVGKLILF